MPRFIRVFRALAVFALLAACGGTSDPPGPPSGETALAVPDAVIQSARIIADAARDGDPAGVAALAGAGFEFDFVRPETTFAERLDSDDGDLLRRLVTVLESAPGRRQSPFGNGTVQELWVYPALSLEVASQWTEPEIDEALSGGLFSAADLVEYRAADAYLGYSVGISPEGDWIFFTAGRVGRSPR